MKIGTTAKDPMQLGRKIEVTIEGYGEAKTFGEVSFLNWNKRERTLRAFKFGAGSWGLAIISVFIPLLHFILVPAFLLAGPIVAFFVLKQEGVISGGKGTCPYCKKIFTIVHHAPHFPIADLCEHCKKSVKIERTSQLDPLH